MSPRLADSQAYAHLFGLYLGDGHLNTAARGPQLAFHFDAIYPQLIAEADASIKAVAGRSPQYYTREGWRVTILKLAWKGWPALFPQHGPGRKHERPIVLEPWQQRIVDRHPEAFLLGLVQSDGCRTINRFTTALPSGRVAEYAYPRYFFSNESADIRGLFCQTCERLGVRWTQSNRRNISVAHRDSVAILDAFIGPKR
ncbi:hypothetical protein [Paraconexibacter sp. AEG42_29]|uniref:hypothetical protein n=1 Tax=Paraconexibacter sp. AEG42_29 TaxID=2997339 RepID=UPI00339D65F8